MDAPHLIDHHQLSRNWHYWRVWCLRHVRLGQGMIYNQTVGSLNTEHEQIPPLYSGDAKRGKEIEQDYLPIGREGTLSLKDFWSTANKQPEAIMRRSGVSSGAIYLANRFDWLADLHALAQTDPKDEDSNKTLDSKEKNETCITTLRNWIRCHQYWSPLAWHVPTLAQRINNWLYFYKEFFGAGVNTSFDSLFFASISKQLDHLHYSVLHETQGFERIASLVCWVNAGLCISSEEKRLSEGIALLSIELHNLFKKPHQELLSSPRLIHETHHLLYHISKGFLRQKLSIPPEIAQALPRLEALVKEYKTPKGTLARFHGTWDLPEKSIKLPRKIIKNTQTTPLSKPALIKTVRGDFEIVLDASSCSKNGSRPYQHISPLAIEIYDGTEPLVINLSPPNRDSLCDSQEHRMSEFHSMPLLEDVPLGTIRNDGHLEADYTVSSEVLNQDGLEIQSVICRHNGYLKSVGGILERRIDIWDDPKKGTVIQGRDSLEFHGEPRTDDPLRLITLFHLHPDLETMPLQGGGILAFKKKSKVTATWKFAPVDKDSKIATVDSMTRYHEGLDPRKVHSLWMGRSIPHPQNLASYCNEWALFRNDT